MMIIPFYFNRHERLQSIKKCCFFRRPPFFVASIFDDDGHSLFKDSDSDDMVRCRSLQAFKTWYVLV